MIRLICKMRERLAFDPIRLELIRMAFDPRVSRLTREHIANGPGFFPYRIDQAFQHGRAAGAAQVGRLLSFGRLTPAEAVEKIEASAVIIQRRQTRDYDNKTGLYRS